MSEHEAVYCLHCNIELPDLSEQYLIEDQILCEDCYNEHTVSCYRCGERIWNEDNEGHSGIPLCLHCYENHYTTCTRCGNMLAYDDAEYAREDDDDGEPYCYSCYERYIKNSYLQSYSYKPTPIFHGEKSRFFGVELEIDNAGKDPDNARTLCELANRFGNHIYIKADSSLDDGLEIVTHPMTLEYHTESMPWREVLAKAAELGYRSHMASTCGLHVHVNRDSFTDSYTYQEECIARVLYIVERFWEELLRFSRRTPSQLRQWANRYGYKEIPEEILDTAKNGHSGRYTCVNLTNTNTIEFRIFRGTLKYNTLMATLQLVSEICKVAFSSNDGQVSALSWCDFMERISPEECPELVTYLKERRLYINEPVYCESEV